jgi:hypothetical protein
MAEKQADQADKPAEAPAPAGHAMEIEESAPEHAPLKDALGNDPVRAVDNGPAAPTIVVHNDAEALATKPDADLMGAGGVALPGVGEVAGGNITKLLAPPPSTETISRPMAKEQAAMKTKVGQQIAGLIARPVTDWGIIGPGDVVRGHMLLLDLNTGQKVRAMDGHRVNEGELYMNLRNVPEALATGDTIDQVLGA